MSAMTLRSGKELKEPLKNGKVEHEMEVNKSEPITKTKTPPLMLRK